MSSRCPERAAVAAMLAALACVSCEREQRAFRATPPPAVANVVQASDIRAGPPGAPASAALRANPQRIDVETRPGRDDQLPNEPSPGQLSDEPRRSSDGVDRSNAPFQSNRWAVGEGKRLYEWFNCAGCHSPGGGGGMGPSFMDAQWRYGDAPGSVFASIVEGRPMGMPSFRERLNPSDVWKLVAYVRTLGRLTPKDVWPARGDEMAELQFEGPRSRGSGPAAAAEPASQPELTP
jgi:cytochrome c oxidase cbb3-type subunit III